MLAFITIKRFNELTEEARVSLRTLNLLVQIQDNPQDIQTCSNYLKGLGQLNCFRCQYGYLENEDNPSLFHYKAILDAVGELRNIQELVLHRLVTTNSPQSVVTIFCDLIQKLPNLQALSLWSNDFSTLSDSEFSILCDACKRFSKIQIHDLSAARQAQLQNAINELKKEQMMYYLQCFRKKETEGLFPAVPLEIHQKIASHLKGT